ncbi:hypothetical protein HBO19_08165 [Pseudomonas sp. WS 5021]|uniref:hypothetical protein n=1 Tax=Pseudomonas sp. WS 5021 TaxID=2717490 RepID=UPI0014741718|nr:hypothetical protein [Pseudomonas sp. WS 5021]NMY25947.1 hypothetical protein [Pseudomonas sp. WS 5021]
MAKPTTTTNYTGVITSIGDYPQIAIVWGEPEKPPTKSALVKPDGGSKDVIFDIGSNYGPEDFDGDAIDPFPLPEEPSVITKSDLGRPTVEGSISPWPSLRSSYFKVGDRVSFIITDGPLGAIPNSLRKI